jgi:4-alpha-glucanotransferase
MKFNRASGILLHPTSLPGPYGIGDIGPAARRWVDFLAEADCTLWQMLPLGPTGYGDSPYQCFSAFAGNPYLISPDDLLAEDLLTPDDLANLPPFPQERVDYGAVIPWKLALLDRAYELFRTSASESLHQDFLAFQTKHAHWLDDFALFMALKEKYGGASWVTWPEPLRQRHPQALTDARQELTQVIQRQMFRQFIFFRQWQTLRVHASRRGILLIGDIPIFVAHDSADVWAHPELFFLDQDGNPSVVAGVPPDYFSPTGQLWGNPLYRWKVHKASGYAWWLERIRSVLSLVDIVRLDHFRGFAAYWEVPGKAQTAEKGRWVKGPGRDFFRVIKANLGDLPIIAEDLGVITPDVVAIRDEFGLPGMKILQFAFEGQPSDPFLPHNYSPHCVVYTGTHDNDTTRGWFERVTDKERTFCLRYLGCTSDHIVWDLIRLAWASVAVFALAPLQDFLNLGNEARMNYPSRPSGNWAWRMPPGVLNGELSQKIKELNYLYYRQNKREGLS